MKNEEKTYDYDGTKLTSSDLEHLASIPKGSLKSAKKERYGYQLRYRNQYGGDGTGFLSSVFIDKYLSRKYSKARKWEGGIKGLRELIKKQINEDNNETAQCLANVINFITLHRNQWSIQFSIDSKYVDALLASGISSKDIEEWSKLCPGGLKLDHIYSGQLAQRIKTLYPDKQRAIGELKKLKALKDMLEVMNRKTNGDHWLTKY
jgi:hypothetical protein